MYQKDPNNSGAKKEEPSGASSLIPQAPFSSPSLEKESLGNLKEKLFTRLCDQNISPEALLQEFGPELAPLLAANIRDAGSLSARAAAMLCDLGPQARPVVPDLVEMLRHPTYVVRTWAAYVLGNMHMAPEGSVSELSQALRDPDWKLRAMAAWTLRMYGSRPDSDIPALIEALQDHRFEVRQEAALALGWSGQLAAVSPLFRVMRRDHSLEVRLSAVKALGIIDVKSPGTLGPVAYSEMKEVVAVALKHRYLHLRLSGISALSRISSGVEEAVPWLNEAQGDPHISVREAAAIALQSIQAGKRDGI